MHATKEEYDFPPYTAINTTLNVHVPFFFIRFSFLVGSTLGNETVAGIRFLPQGHLY